MGTIKGALNRVNRGSMENGSPAFQGNINLRRNPPMVNAKKNNRRSLKLTERVTKALNSPKVASHIEVFNEYSKQSGIPMEQILHECLSEYIAEQCPKR
jgi:hypothetical protein